MKPLGKVKIKWSPEFAYAIGLLTTDGNLSPDGRHINLTSKDKELVVVFLRCLGLKNKIRRKARGNELIKKYFVVQIGDVLFYKFLLFLGLMSCKSKKLGVIKIPKEYVFDFLRGHFDGDGTFYSYWDKRWRSSFMFYTTFISASKNHIVWLRSIIAKLLSTNGHITKSKENACYQLKYAKKESLKLLPKMYYSSDVVCLMRKRKKIEIALKIQGKRL